MVEQETLSVVGNDIDISNKLVILVTNSIYALVDTGQIS